MRKFCFRYGTKVRTWFSKSTERIFTKILYFVYLHWYFISFEYETILTHKFWEKLTCLKKIEFLMFFRENFTFHKIYELNFFETFFGQNTVQLMLFLRFLGKSVRSIFCTVPSKKRLFQKSFSQMNVKFQMSRCAKFFIFENVFPILQGTFSPNFMF